MNEERINDIDERLKSLENMHKFAFIALIGIGGLLLIYKNK
jgi:hypothetical protein